MSDITIPGVTSKYDTKKLIEDLMKVERIPKDRAEEQLKALQLQKTAWLDVNRSISRARESSRALFSFQNPFNERIAKFADGKAIRYININDKLADKDGRLFDGMMNPADKLHPTLKGYQIWADALKPIFTEILGPPAKEDHAPPPTGDPGAAAAHQASPSK